MNQRLRCWCMNITVTLWWPQTEEARAIRTGVSAVQALVAGARHSTNSSWCGHGHLYGKLRCTCRSSHHSGLSQVCVTGAEPFVCSFVSLRPCHLIVRLRSTRQRATQGIASRRVPSYLNRYWLCSLGIHMNSIVQIAQPNRISKCMSIQKVSLKLRCACKPFLWFQGLHLYCADDTSG